MKTFLDCIPCFFRQALAAARLATPDEKVHRQILNSVATMIPTLKLDVTPPEIAREVYGIIYTLTGNHDPYAEVKEQANRAALALYPRMKEIVKHSDVPLETACKLAIAGNAIDLGACESYGALDAIIEEATRFHLDPNHFESFAQAIRRAHSIVYLADNAGEIVFDRILIETIKQLEPVDITFVVRESPIINDATLKDAQAAGIPDIATVITNGSNAPATVLSHCSPELTSAFQSADLIISKGQGNYESLSERTENIFFLFKVKCPVVARDSGMAMGSAVLCRCLVEEK